MANRLIELAIEALENQRATIDNEISALRAGFRAGVGALRKGRKASAKRASKAQAPKRRKRSAASRKAQSLKMKAYWAAKRLAAKSRGAKKA